MPSKKKTAKMLYKMGTLSNAEKKNVEDWHADMDVLDISQRLNRRPEQVARYIKEFLAGAPRLVVKRSEAEDLKRELHAHADWIKTKQEFTEQELIYYENDYINSRQQLKDLTNTELKQLHQFITIGIFMHRTNKERKTIQEEIDGLERQIKKYNNIPVDNRTPDDITALTMCLNLVDTRRAGITGKNKDYQLLLKEHNDLLKSLKSTRDQRIKSLEERGKFITLLQELEIESRRTAISESMGLMDLAVLRERERLGAPHQYMDGGIDQPLLTGDNCVAVTEQ